MTDKSRADELGAQLAAMTQDRDHWERSAEMACENPAPGCNCPGCVLAAERQGR